MKLRCLLVDDEPPALAILASYADSLGLEVVGKCYNAFEAMQVLQQKPVDVLFLDIKMPHLLGTELIRTLRNPPKVIFTTAHKDFALEGYDLDAVDYLLKPFSLERFIRAVNKITPVEITSEPAPPEVSSFLYFRIDRKMVRVELEDILYIESLKDYIRIVREVEKPLVVKKSITSVEEMLPAHLFLRIHRSYIVAVKRITAYTHHDVEINGLELPVGRIYRDRFNTLKFLGK
jgi:DNA-binding LytR/AlgR family response regulator